MEKTYKFILPQNKEVEKTNIRIENGEVFIDVEFKEKFEPKDGDFLVSSKGNIFIYNGNYTCLQYGAYCGIDTCNTITICNYISSAWTCKQGCRFATPEEKAAFLARLEKERHKIWNAEKKCLEDIRWRAEKGEYFYYVSTDSFSAMRLQDSRGSVSDAMYNNCNYFRTPEAAQKVADQMKEIFKNSKTE